MPLKKLFSKIKHIRQIANNLDKIDEILDSIEKQLGRKMSDKEQRDFLLKIDDTTPRNEKGYIGNPFTKENINKILNEMHLQ